MKGGDTEQNDDQKWMDLIVRKAEKFPNWNIIMHGQKGFQTVGQKGFQTRPRHNNFCHFFLLLVLISIKQIDGTILLNILYVFLQHSGYLFVKVEWVRERSTKRHCDKIIVRKWIEFKVYLCYLMFRNVPTLMWHTVTPVHSTLLYYLLLSHFHQLIASGMHTIHKESTGNSDMCGARYVGQSPKDYQRLFQLVRTLMDRPMDALVFTWKNKKHNNESWQGDRGRPYVSEKKCFKAISIGINRFT